MWYLKLVFFQFRKIASSISCTLESTDSKVQLKGIYLITLFVTAILACGTEVTFSSDSSGYIEAGRLLASGNIDSIRTPLYPLFCYLLEILLPDSLSYLVINIVQYLVFLISIYAFHYIGKYLIKSPSILFYATLIYACHPATISWTRAILTESFAISGIVFLAYSILRFIQKESYQTLFLINIILLLLIALKPSFGYLLPIMLLLWCYLIFKNKKVVYIAGIGYIIGIIILILGYCYAYQQKYEVFQPSYVSSLNQYYVLRESNLVESTYANNLELKEDIDEFLLVKDTQGGEIYYKEFFYLLENYGISTTQQFISTTLCNKSKGYAQAVLKHIQIGVSQSSFITYVQPLSIEVKVMYKILYFLFNPTFRFLYLFLSIYFIYLLYYSIKKKRIPMLSILIWLLIIANITTVVVGALGEWNRLITPSIPFVCLLVGQCLDQFNMIPIKKTELK
ncbi:MAG: hypothetical protein RRY36_01855 [Bacteroidaceae bacterium]